MTGPDPLLLAVALSAAGRHPAAWREPDARPTELLTPRYWVDLVTEADRGGIDLVTFDDELVLQPDGVRGRLDAVLTAARVAPLTRRVGLVPTAVATHTEPFHLSKAVATLDYVSAGRAGIHVEVTASADAARHFGRREVPESRRELYDEAADYVEVLRRLWDSWEDDAEIRDAATGRFVDRNKLHYIDFEGRWFSVKGPSITPRPPQGLPPVAATYTGDDSGDFVAGADIAFIPAGTAAAGTTPLGNALTFVDLVVFLDDSAERAVARRRRLDDLHGSEVSFPTEVFTGTAAQLADRLEDWQRAGATGVRLHPGALPHDLTQISAQLTGELGRRGPASQRTGTLRNILGLPRPVNRYAITGEDAR